MARYPGRTLRSKRGSFPADFVVVAFFCLFNRIQVGVQFTFFGISRAVNAHQLRFVVVKCAPDFLL